MSAAFQYLGGDQIVLGTDVPFSKADHARVVPAIEESELPPGVKAKIYSENARRLLAI